MGQISLRDYQQGAVDRLRASYSAGNRAPLLVLPTGGGKTVTFAYIAQNSAARGKRALILVHRQELLRQSSATLSGLDVGHGLIAAGGPMSLGQLVQVASVQTLMRRLQLLDRANWRPDLIVVDEAHHATAGSWRTILDHWPGARVLGVTATPCRQDGKGLGVAGGGVFDDMVEGPQIAELIDRGYLAPPEVYAPPVVADLTGLRSRMGDFAQGDTADRMDRPTVTGDAVAHYARICPGVPAIVFCVSVAHAEHVAEQFRASGWRAASLDGSMADVDRRARIDDLAAGRLQILTSCDIISEGTDIPVVGAAILLRPTQSLGLYLQQVGRALRLYPGKAAAIILDHVGNVARHGLPDEPREWSLDGVTKRGRGGDREGPPPPVTCESCFRQIVRPLPPVCPGCGCSLKQAGREASLQHVEGELQKITAADRAAIAAQRKREQGQAETLDDLVAIGRARGYPNPQGWAWRVFTARSGKYSRGGEQKTA
jgi:superfamily II DNA or RNA helicase